LGGDEEEVAGLDVDGALELGAEVEAGAAADDVDRGLAVAVVVDAGGHARRAFDVARPDGGGAARLTRDAGFTDHARGLGGT